MAFIEIRHVTYTYPERQTQKVEETHGAEWKTQPALLNASLEIQAGEYVVIVGHNGSGKSTLARLCNALLLPDDGHVLVDSLDTCDETKRREIRDKVGMIFQNPDNQIIATVVEDDVAWALTVRGLPMHLVAERVEAAMDAVGITSLRQQPPHKLSGGQRQRLAIAGVMALRPQCIIADEATSMLDPLSRREIVSLLHQLNRQYGLTIIQVTHLLEEAALAQRVIVMEQGRPILDETPIALFSDLARLRALNLAIPEPLELANRLRNVGVSLPAEAVTIDALARALARELHS